MTPYTQYGTINCNIALPPGQLSYNSNILEYTNRDLESSIFYFLLCFVMFCYFFVWYSPSDHNLPHLTILPPSLSSILDYLILQYWLKVLSCFFQYLVLFIAQYWRIAASPTPNLVYINFALRLDWTTNRVDLQSCSVDETDTSSPLSFSASPILIQKEFCFPSTFSDRLVYYFGRHSVQLLPQR